MRTTRDSIIESIRDYVKQSDLYIAAWEGGSAAYDDDDAMSDLDLGVVCEDAMLEEVFDDFKTMLDNNYTVKKEIRLPEPTWHGYSQSFIFIDDGPEMFYIDFVVVKKSQKNNLVQSDRHGEARIWFDTENLIDTSPTPEEEIKKRCHGTYMKTKEAFDLMAIEVEQEIIRNRYIDAVVYYYGIVNRIAALQNVLHRSAKYDFGPRYYYREMPAAIVKETEELLRFSSIDDLRKKLEMAKDIFNRLCEEIDEKWKF